jgi:hypothetical protein
MARRPVDPSQPVVPPDCLPKLLMIYGPTGHAIGGTAQQALYHYTEIFQEKIKNFPAVKPRFFGALQCSTITFRVRRTEA